MADISKVKLPGATEAVNLKDATARSNMTTLLGSHELGALGAAAWKDVADSVASGGAGLPTSGAVYTAVNTEETRAKGVEGGLDDRIKNLEARGRFLSSWDASTGLPATYPTIPEGATSPYTYTYKAGDYYIVGTAAAKGSNYQPKGSSITATKEGTTWTWEVGKDSDAREIGAGDYYTYDGTNWVLVQNSQKTVTFANITGSPDDNANLKTELDALRNGKVDKTQKIAGIALSGDIAKADLQTALDLKALAYAATATGSTTLNTIDSIEMNSVTVAGNATVTSTSTDATIATSADYTPAGTIMVDNAAQAANNKVLKAGSINVTVKDAASATAVTDVEYESYTPAGSIAAATGGTFSALKTATFGEDSTNGVQIEGTVSAPAITVTAGSEKTFATGLTGGSVASFTEGAFTPASISTGFFSAGSQASYEHTGFSGGSFTKGTAVTAATEGIVATVGTGEDSETLIFSAAATDAVMDHDASFTAAVYGTDNFVANTLPSIDTTKFDGGSKAADTFVANTLQEVSTDKVHDTPTAALAEAPAFTGKKYKVATTDDTALKEVTFTGTPSDVKFKGAKYLKQEINTATFSGTEATLGFTGTETKNLIPTKITYDKADATAAFSETVTPTTKTLTKTAKTVTIQVSPDAV